VVVDGEDLVRGVRLCGGNRADLGEEEAGGSRRGIRGCGWAVKRRTTTVKRCPSATVLSEVITSSDPCRVKDALRPSTATDRVSCRGAQWRGLTDGQIRPW